MRTFVIHVKSVVEREENVRQQLANQNLDWEFILEGDKDELKEEELQHYFSGRMATAVGEASCAYKHMLALENIVAQQLPYALILEDDFILKPHFKTILPVIEKEFSAKKQASMAVLEDSDNLFIPRSKRKKNTYLYPAAKGTTTAAYLMNYEGAKAVLAWVKSQKPCLPADWLYEHCMKEGILDVYRTHRAPVRQTTFDGTTKSLISDNRVGLKRIIGYRLQRAYKNSYMS